MKLTKTALILFGLVVLAAVLSLISAQHFAIGADEMIYTVIPFHIISAHRLSTIEQAPVYFYLVDLGYKLFGGMNLVTGRLPSIFFGSLTVLLVFLCTLELSGNKNSALWSAFFFALSGYALRNNQEMDMTAFFFALLSIFFFLKVLKDSNNLSKAAAFGGFRKTQKFFVNLSHLSNPSKNDFEKSSFQKFSQSPLLQGNTKWLYPSTAFLAIAVLVKPIVLLFVPAYAVVWVVKSYRQKTGIFVSSEEKLLLSKKTILVLFACLLLSILLVSPVLVYNYLLYKDKGMTDYYFTTLAGIGSSVVYQGQEANHWMFSRSLSISKGIFSTVFRFDALLFIFGFLGLSILFKKEKWSVLLFLFSLFFLLLFLAGIMGGTTHFFWIPLVLSIFAGPGFLWTQEKLLHAGRIFGLVMIVLAVLNAGAALHDIVPQKKMSIAITLQEYGQEHFPSDALVVLDPRIYRGIFAWAFPDQHYLEGTYFPQLMNNLPALSGQKREIPLYYVECGPGTNCGWKPEDFQRIYDFGEQLSTLFRTKTQKVAEIKAVDTFLIYRGSISAPDSIYEAVDRTHSFWYTPVGWKYPEEAVDNYTVKTFFDKLLQGFGFFILYADVVLALLSPFLVVFLLGKRS